jgi:hypothetical protein
VCAVDFTKRPLAKEVERLLRKEEAVVGSTGTERALV